MSLIDGEPRSASVRTVTDAKLLVIHRESFLSLLRKTPEIAMALMGELCKRLRKANRQIGSLSTMSVSGRVAGTLLNLMQERGVRIHTDNGNMVTVIHNRPTQQQLADMSGTTRETVSRICSLLVRTNAIAMTGKDIVIFDEDVLQEKATKG
jgi:CRP/FNR family transcriptional regulator/CRP/FNR family cyclic AMP-dependent transcriptional regulator